MHITEATLLARDLDAVEKFYREVLDLRTERHGPQVRVQVGTSRLVFEQGQYQGVQHLAFTIPTGRFAVAKRWLEGRTELLAEDGVVEFEGPPSWESRSLYFDGPDGQILELIERRRRRRPGGLVSGSELLVCVSEIGVTVSDVLDAVQRLAGAGARPFGGEPTAEFAAVGDDDGLLILGAIGRSWKPTQQVGYPAAVRVAMDGVAPVQLSELQAVVALHP